MREHRQNQHGNARAYLQGDTSPTQEERAQAQRFHVKAVSCLCTGAAAAFVSPTTPADVITMALSGRP